MIPFFFFVWLNYVEKIWEKVSGMSGFYNKKEKIVKK